MAEDLWRETYQPLRSRRFAAKNIVTGIAGICFVPHRSLLFRCLLGYKNKEFAWFNALISESIVYIIYFDGILRKKKYI